MEKRIRNWPSGPWQKKSLEIISKRVINIFNWYPSQGNSNARSSMGWASIRQIPCGEWLSLWFLSTLFGSWFGYFAQGSKQVSLGTHIWWHCFISCTITSFFLCLYRAIASLGWGENALLLLFPSPSPLPSCLVLSPPPPPVWKESDSGGGILEAEI